MDRPSWSNKLEYHLSLFSYIIGLSTSWRFTYLAIENNGAPFLYSFLVLLLLIGIPIVFMELTWGQYCNLAPLQAFKLVPVLQGVGVCIFIMSCILIIYFGVVSYYLLIYLTSSFVDPFPWETCENSWNSKYCGLQEVAVKKCINETSVTNSTIKELCVKNVTDNIIYSPALEYYKSNVALKSDFCSNISYNNISEVIYGDGGQILISPLIIFAIFIGLRILFLFISLFKYVTFTGKISYLFSTFPFAVSIMMLVRCLTLDNFTTSLSVLFIPKDIQQFDDPKLWKDALGQVFISLMTCWGGLLTWSSYNKFYNKYHIDASVIIIILPIISILYAISMFSIVGFLTGKYNTTTDIVLDNIKGPFSPIILLSEVLLTMWGYKLPWSVLVFTTIYLSSVATQLPNLECIISSISDSFEIFKRLWLRNFLVFFTIILSTSIYYILPCFFQGFGIKLIELLDTFFISFSLSFLAIIYLFVICFAFGFQLLSANAKAMTRNSCLTSRVWFISWGFLTPTFLFTCIVYMLYGVVVKGMDGFAPTVHTALKLQSTSLISWILVSLLFLVIILFAAVNILRATGDISEKLKQVFSASPASADGVILSTNRTNIEGSSELFMSGVHYTSQHDNDETFTDNNIVTSV